MELNKSNQKQGSAFKSIFAIIVIPVALLVAIVIYLVVMGNGSNFEGGNPDNNPIPGNYLGMVYKGGAIVPILMTLLLVVIIFSIERFFTLMKASGKGNIDSFIRKVNGMLATKDIHAAVAECDIQKGSVANVLREGLHKYQEMEKEQVMDKEQKMLAIQKEVEEATALELPMLEKNLVFLATIASIATLMGLLGTVLGMIRSFAALAHAGAPDSVALATGISEALINTAFGIATSALAIIMYNVYTTKIDKITYSIDEVGFSLVQTFASSHK